MMENVNRTRPVSAELWARGWYLVGMVGLLILAGCVPGASPTTEPVTGTTPVPSADQPTMTVSQSPPTAKPTASPTSLPPTRPPATLTAEPALTRPAGDAGNADVMHVRAVEEEDGTWTFHVTVQHPDTGWEDYADGWDVVTPDGTVLKPDPDSPFTRLLTHPHVSEQPFTRSQGGIVVPEGVTQVQVRAHDLVDGYGGRQVVVDLTLASGPDFQVERKP